MRKNWSRVFPGSPVVKTSPSNEGGTGSLSSLLEELRSHVPPGQKKNKTKQQQKTRSNIVTKTLKMVHVKTSWMKKTEAKIIPVTCLTALSSGQKPGFKCKQTSSKIHMLWPFFFVYGIGGYVGVFPFQFLQRSLTFKVLWLTHVLL